MTPLTLENLPPVARGALEFAFSTASDVRQLAESGVTLESTHEALAALENAMRALTTALDAAESVRTNDILLLMLADLVRAHLSARSALEKVIEIRCAMRRADDTVH